MEKRTKGETEEGGDAMQSTKRDGGRKRQRKEGRRMQTKAETQDRGKDLEREERWRRERRQRR